MGEFVNRLRELGVEDDGYVTLSYSEGCEVWHINESHVQESVAETETAAKLAGLLVSGIPVYGNYGRPTEAVEFPNEIRAAALMEA